MSPVKVFGAAWSAGALVFAGTLIGVFIRKIKGI